MAGLLIAWLHRPGVTATVAWLRRLPRAAAISQAHELYEARNDVRTTAVQAAAGIVVLLGAYFTWRQVQNSTRILDHTPRAGGSGGSGAAQR